MIEIIHLSKSYDDGNSFSVDNISIQIRTGEIFVIVGSSGSGKTTLLKMINRLILPSSGQIKINDRDINTYEITQLRRRMGYVFQGIGLFPHMTVAENVSIVLRLCHVPKKERFEKACDLLRFVNLDPDIYADRMPAELSGGQQQRVGVARALANDPECLLMDEPFGALDPITRDALQNDLLHLNKKLKKTIIFVTHDIFEALRIADRIAVMHHGKLEQVGTKKYILENPSTNFVRDLFSKAHEKIIELGESIS